MLQPLIGSHLDVSCLLSNLLQNYVHNLRKPLPLNYLSGLHKLDLMLQVFAMHIIMYKNIMEKAGA